MPGCKLDTEGLVQLAASSLALDSPVKDGDVEILRVKTMRFGKVSMISVFLCVQSPFVTLVALSPKLVCSSIIDLTPVTVFSVGLLHGSSHLESDGSHACKDSANSDMCKPRRGRAHIHIHHHDIS